MMKSRGLVVGIAAVLTVAAAAFVYLYTNGVKNEAATGGSLSTVIVAKQDIPANTALDPLIEQGVFTQLRVPSDAVVDGAITDPGQLRGLTTTAPILANEQIPASRLDTGQAPAGGNLGITEGNVGLSIELDTARGVEGHVTNGDNVVLYATFSADTPIRKTALRQLLSAAQIQKLLDATQNGTVPSATSPVIKLGVPFTVALVPSVRVLDVQNPSVDETGKASSGNISMTLDLSPSDATNVVFASENANLWVALLPPQDPHGYPTEGSFGPSFNEVVGAAR
jgi:Flp pilus assembly protein CpaB